MKLYRYSPLYFWVLFFLSGTAPVLAQGGYIDQTEVEEVLTAHRADSIDSLPIISYDYFILKKEEGDSNTVRARNAMYKILGDGDIKKGHNRAKLVELINRVLLRNLQVGDTLVVPRKFDLDFRAYAPFPLHYPGARTIDKLFIIHKTVQAWAAYEYGELARWGIVNTGARENPTPTGRYNFNWKEPYSVSSLSPADEPWEMYWVFNFHLARGIHVHQYPMPTGGPTSHGCVRLVETDAKWIYDWAVPWTNTKGTGIDSQTGKIIKPGSLVLVLGEDPVDVPHPFEYRKNYPFLRKVELPDNPYSVPPGTEQQKFWDRKLRFNQASR